MQSLSVVHDRRLDSCLPWLSWQTPTAALEIILDSTVGSGNAPETYQLVRHFPHLHRYKLGPSDSSSRQRTRAPFAHCPHPGNRDGVVCGIPYGNAIPSAGLHPPCRVLFVR
jgi:hypothetical protein